MGAPLSVPPPVRLLSFDLDGTLLGHPESVQCFADWWETLPRGFRPLLVYNTSRTVADVGRLVAQRHLPEPDCVIGSLGTELQSAMYHLSDSFRAQFRRAWDLRVVEDVAVEFPDLKRQPPEFLNPFKSSWYWPQAGDEEVRRLRDRLASRGVAAHVAYSCRYFLDVVPASAGKGRALEWLCRRLSIAPSHVVVAGDSGNDCSMFELEGVRGILVANALPELRRAVAETRTFFAAGDMARGILEGLRHYGVLASGREPAPPAGLPAAPPVIDIQLLPPACTGPS